MTPEQEKFLNDIAAELKTQPGFNDVEQLFFPLRFDKNRPRLYKHKDIAENLMRPEGSKLPLDFYSKSIGTTVQNIVSGMVGRLKTEHKKAISGLYEAEIRADGVDVDSLLNGKQGERGTWEVVYDWLWKHKYLRWLEENGWQILQEKAKSPDNWIKFLTEDEVAILGTNRGSYLEPPPPEVTPNIPAKQRLLMAINLEYPNYQLLLFNRSEQGTVLHCPSFGYALNPIMDKPPISLPQKDSFAHQTGQKFIFKETGKEEFLAIVLEKPLNLNWLTPQRQDALPKCNAERIQELFYQLEQQGNWHVFYQNFEVVETV
jgi:hypothetical protein